MRALLTLLLVLAAPALRAEPAGASSPTISGLRFEGAGAAKDKDLKRALNLSLGQLYDPTRLENARENLASYFQNEGYLAARVLAAARVQGGGAELVFTVTAGPRTSFGATRLSGLERLRPDVVTRELPYLPGEPYRRRALFVLQSRLYGLGLFDDVSVTASTTPAQTAEVDIRLKERPMKWIKAGVGYGADERERLSLTISHDNLFRHAYRLEGQASVSRIWLDYRAEFVNRYFLGTRTEQRTQLSWRRENRESYNSEATQGRLSLGRQLAPLVHGQLHYRVQQTVVYKVSPDVRATTPDQSYTGAIGFSLTRDSTDAPFTPRTGSRQHLAFERSGGTFGGNIHYYRASTNVTAYQPLWRSLIAALGGRAGVIQETGPTREVPVFERFFTGGANSVRGYRERSVGPTDAEGSPLGAKVLLGAGTELRFPLFWKLAAALFVDGGQVGQKLSFAQPSRWKWGAGPGLRLVTPLGPLRADMGYKVNPDPGDRALWRLHLSLGEAF